MNLQFFSGLIIGGVITWIVAHVYYRKSNLDQNTIYRKLSKDIRDSILQDSRDKLSVQELNDLIEQKTIDPESRAPFQFKACPKCGSNDLQHGEYIDYARDDSWYYIKCKNCDWHDVTQ